VSAPLPDVVVAQANGMPATDSADLMAVEAHTRFLRADVSGGFGFARAIPQIRGIPGPDAERGWGGSMRSDSADRRRAI